VAALRAAGADVLPLPADRAGKVSVRALLRALAKRQLASLLVEGGAELAAAFQAARAVDELRLFVAPKIFGGGARGGKSWVGGAPIARLAHATALTPAAPPQQIGPDTLLVLRPQKAPW
jgi:diaminohydroxyphosphoribosylaminopyrimidine deaminase/5-amino-6-(5-phosphoribosylamino)uracil reductase